MFSFKQPSLERAYALFVLTILTLVLVAFFIMNNFLKDQHQYGELINMSGKQRMLSQRIVLKATQVFENRQIEQLQSLKEALALMKQEHRYLLDHLPSEEQRSIYFGKSYELDKKVNRFIERMENEVLSNNLAVLEDIEMEDDMLPILNYAVSSLQKEYEAKVHRSKMTEIAVFIFTIVTIILEAIFIVVPAIQQIREAKDEAEKASSAKSEFLANMSHEIRTPINAMMGFVELLQKRDFDAATKKYLGIILEGARSLEAIVNDILDFSKMSSSKVFLEHRPFNLIQTVTNTVELFTISASAKQIQYLFFIDPLLPECVDGDVSRLKQLMNNLIGNAIKFTDENGTVKIKATYNPDTQVFRFAVKDTGIGIAPEKLETIFEPFEQADNSIARKYGGTGLGLAISKNLVESMKGTLSVESKENEGSTFVVEISLLRCVKPN